MFQNMSLPRWTIVDCVQAFKNHYSFELSNFYFCSIQIKALDFCGFVVRGSRLMKKKLFHCIIHLSSAVWMGRVDECLKFPYIWMAEKIKNHLPQSAVELKNQNHFSEIHKRLKLHHTTEKKSFKIIVKSFYSQTKPPQKIMNKHERLMEFPGFASDT